MKRLRRAFTKGKRQSPTKGLSLASGLASTSVSITVVRRCHESLGLKCVDNVSTAKEEGYSPKTVRSLMKRRVNGNGGLPK